MIYNYKSLHINDEIICKSDKTPYQRLQLNTVLNQLKQRTRNGEKNLILKYKNNIPPTVSTDLPGNSSAQTHLDKTKNKTFPSKTFQ